MDILKKFNKEKTSPNKKVKFYCINNNKKQINYIEDIQLKKISSYKGKKDSAIRKGKEKDILLPISLDHVKMSKYRIEQGKHFMKKILQMKKEINKNEFSNFSEGKENIIKNKNSIMKKIGTDLKQSLLNLRLESGYELSPRKSIKMKKSKTKYNDNNIIKSNVNSPKNKNNKNTSIFNTNFNLNNTVKSNVDSTRDNKDNNSKLELLINEEINNSTIKNINKSDNVNKNVISKKSNKSNKSNEVISKNTSNEKYRKLTNRGLVYDSFDDEEEFEDQINKEYFIKPNSIFIYILDALVALNILYYLTYNPYYIASSTTFLFSNILNLREIYHFFMEFVFFVDFLVQFIRAYYDFDENLVTSRKKIILHYLSSWFFIDLITVIPTFTIIKLYYEKEKYNYGYDYICRYGCQSDNLIHLICFIKIIKVSKLLNRNENQFVSFIVSHFSNTSFMDNWGTLIFEVILTILALHITACIHIIIGRNSYPNWIIINNLAESNFSTIYLTSIYFLITTLTSVGYGDITGNGLNEHIFQIFLLIVGIIAYSWMVSSVSNYFVENNKDNTFFSSKVSILDEIKLVHPEMDNELYNKIYLYLKQLTLQHKRKDKNILLENLPYNLRNELLYEINKPLIEGLNFFKNFHNSVFILSAVTKLIPIVTVKGDIIIEQNEIINSMIFVKQGRLGVEIAVDMNNISNEVDNYLNGTFILEKEGNKDKEKEKEKLTALQYKRKNAFSLMSTFNYTMDDSFIFGKQRKLDLNYKRPVSFRKKLLKFMEKKFGSNTKGTKSINKKKIKYIKLYYIRKGEQFGEIFMFLNKPSSFTVRVKSPKAELLLLKKIDAIEISSNYPNIWKRANKKSFKNFIHLKELVTREVVKFCEKNGIKYNRTYKLEDIQRFKSLPNLEKNKKKDKKNNISEKIKKFQLNNQSLTNKNKSTINNNIININNTDININKTSDINKPNLKVLDTKKLIDDDNKSNNNSIISENNDNNNIIQQLTPYNVDEINSEIYNGEIFTENIRKNTNSIDKTNYDNESNYFNLFKNDENNSHIYRSKKHKNLIKLIDSSRGKKNLKLHYHKNKKSILKSNNYNVQYNINNSFNINQMQKNSVFLTNQLSISNPISFKINKIYENLNIISQGHYRKDFIFQKKIKIIFQNKYNTENNNNIDINSDNNTNTNSISSTKNLRNSMKNRFIRKVTRVSSFISPKNTFYKNSKILSIIKESEVKSNQFRNQRRKTLENIKTINKSDKSKKAEKEKSSAMINRITKNIIDGDKNLNNPEIFYNELFANIINNKNNDLTSSMLMKNLQLKKTIRKGDSKKSTAKKRTIKNNLSINTNATIK